MIHISKVGGSLFDLADLGDRIRQAITHLEPANNVLIAGGGEFTDLIAKAQTHHSLCDVETHWLCIKTLGVTASLLKALLPEAKLTDQPLELADAAEPSLWILDTEQLLKNETASEAIRLLPRDWTVTTDSIAAAVAVELQATELVLLKSTNCQPEAIQSLAQQHLVDSYFHIAAAPIPKIGWINLRQSIDCTWIKATQ
jgi:5-(aminomethyl)-3-furanmethanol phosphate kinase